MRFEAVIFDMDDVLCHLDDKARLSVLVSLTGRARSDLAHELWGSGFEDFSDRGGFSAEEYLAEFGRRIGYPLSEAEWVQYRKAGMTPIPGSLALAREVSEVATVAVLTNNGHQLKKSIALLFPELLQIFGPNIYVSAEFGTQKPDPNIYRALCDRLGCEPVNCAFIDDRSENVEGARAAGLTGHHFQSPLSLRAFLGS